MTRYNKRAAADAIQKCVDVTTRDISSGNSSPEIPLDALIHAAEILKTFIADNSDLVWWSRNRSIESSVGQEYLQRLALRYRGTENGTHVAEALRSVDEQIQNAFPCVH
jgi:hypothetical protein